MISLQIEPPREITRLSSASLRMIMVRPPALRLLPRRRTRPGSLAASVLLHAAAMAALIWLPRLLPAPIMIAQKYTIAPEPVVLDKPLALRLLPRLEDRAPATARSKTNALSRGASSSAPATIAAPPKPDFSAPQTIVSNIASPVNRIQTILRPDLAAPPKLKFPLRLESVVILPPTTAPMLAPRPPEPLAEPAPVFAPEEAPAIKPTVQMPVLTLKAKKGSVVRASGAPSPTVSPNLKPLPGTTTNAMKALVIVNAVQVAPDPSVAVPDGQLAGRFVVGPAAAGLGLGSSSASFETGSVTGTAAGRSPSAGDGHSSTLGREHTAADQGGPGVSISPNSGGGEGAAATKSGTSGAGSGSVTGGAPGISISGGGSGRGAGTANSFPVRPSYPLMIISGGGGGGASRDLGVFSRNETVYSVSIPMADSGGGPDWTMQYALLNAAQAGTGLLVPPIAQRKIAANVKAASTSVAMGPVFISAIIDESGKLQALKPVRAQDTRSQVAMRALEQWEFLPAQLDGKPVASKVLVGVAVNVQQ
jgi:hypothetical protein